MTEILNIITELTKAYGEQTGIYLVLLVFALYIIKEIVKASSASISKYIDHKLFKNEEDHKIAIVRRKNTSPEVRRVLTSLLQEVDADRALVFEYSNGSSNLAGLPFLYVTATCEILNRNVTNVSQQYQKINTSLLASFLEDLEEKGLLCIENIEDVSETYPILYHMMKSNGVKSAMFYTIDGMNDPIGFICISTIGEKILDKQKSIIEIAHHTQKVSALLNYNNINETV